MEIRVGSYNCQKALVGNSNTSHNACTDFPLPHSSQINHAYQQLEQLEQAREESLRHDEYVEKMVEQAHHDTLRERAAAATKLAETRAEVDKLRGMLERERGVHARVEQDLAESTRITKSNSKELETQKNEADSLRSQLNDTFEQLRQARDLLRASQAKVADFESRVDGAEQSLTEARARSPVHRKTIEKTQKDLTKALGENKGLRSEISELKSELKKVVNELTRAREAPASPEGRHRSRGGTSTAPVESAVTSAVAAQVQALEERDAALKKCEKDIHKREDEIAQAYKSIEEQSNTLDLKRAARDEELREKEQEHVEYLEKQSMLAVATASAAAAQAASQYDEGISKREEEVSRQEDKLSERHVLFEREQARMAEVMRRAETDAAAAKAELKTIEEFAAKVNARSVELGMSMLSPKTEKNRSRKRNVNPWARKLCPRLGLAGSERRRRKRM